MTWAWLSAAAVLLGAVLNAEAECQTGRDITAGSGRPLGARVAAKADMVEPAPAESARYERGQGADVIFATKPSREGKLV